MAYVWLLKSKTMNNSSNERVKYIMKHCANTGISIIGRNLFYVCSQFYCNITEVFNSKLCFFKTEVREEQCMTVEFVTELLNTRNEDAPGIRCE